MGGGRPPVSTATIFSLNMAPYTSLMLIEQEQGNKLVDGHFEKMMLGSPTFLQQKPL